jgi:hypothetical protein
MDGSCSTNFLDEKHIKMLLRKPEGKTTFLRSRIILK